MPNAFGDHFTDMAQPLFRSLVDVTFLTGKGQRKKKVSRGHMIPSLSFSLFAF